MSLREIQPSKIIWIVMGIIAVFAPICIKSSRFTGFSEGIDLIFSFWIWDMTQVGGTPPGIYWAFGFGGAIVFLALIRIFYANYIIRYIQGTLSTLKLSGLGIFVDFGILYGFGILITSGGYWFVWTPIPVLTLVSIVVVLLRRSKNLKEEQEE